MTKQSKVSAASNGKVSGPVVVFVLFSGAFLLFGILFYVAYRQKLSDQAALSAANSSEFTDSATATDKIHTWMKDLPGEWVKVTLVEGQGFVVFIPCYSPNAELTLKSQPDSLPRIACELCDTISEYAVQSIAIARRDRAWDFRLEPTAGRLRILPVSDSLLRNFPEAPFRNQLLLWTKESEGGKTDTLIFVPKTQVSEFETVRAEDESPEGCGTGSMD